MVKNNVYAAVIMVTSYDEQARALGGLWPLDQADQPEPQICLNRLQYCIHHHHSLRLSPNTATHFIFP